MSNLASSAFTNKKTAYQAVFFRGKNCDLSPAGVNLISWYCVLMLQVPLAADCRGLEVSVKESIRAMTGLSKQALGWPPPAPITLQRTLDLAVSSSKTPWPISAPTARWFTQWRAAHLQKAGFTLSLMAGREHLPLVSSPVQKEQSPPAWPHVLR